MLKAELITSMGNDDFVCDAARVSMDKQADQFSCEQNAKLLKYLAKHDHWSPFAHPQITMRETVPIFVARQRFKHVAGFCYNEVSRRYVDTPPEFYTPDVWRSRPEGSIKQGSGGGTVMYLEDPHCSGSLIHTDYLYQRAVGSCEEVYSTMLESGVAPEQARMVLPQSMLTSYYVTGSLSAWARAYKLRIDSHSQVEIQELAKQWNTIISPLFPESWKVLTGETL